MIKLVIKLLFYFAGIFIAAYILPGIAITDTRSLIMVGLVLVALSFTLKPILKILTFPINLMTLGLVGFLINGLIIVIASYLVTGFLVENFIWALLFSLSLSIISFVLDILDDILLLPFKNMGGSSPRKPRRKTYAEPPREVGEIGE